MSSLEDVYCLGCKTRHEKVEIQAVKKMTVRNSIRYQAYGICPEGKKWTKIMKKDAIPDGVPMEDHTKSSEEKVEVNEPAPIGEEEVVIPMPVFQKALESVAGEDLVVEESVVEESVVEAPVVEEPVVEELVIEELVVEPLVVEEDTDDEEEEEDGGEYVQLNHVRPRTPRPIQDRESRTISPPPNSTYEIKEDLVEKSYSMGERMGFLIAQESGVEFMDRFDESLSRTRIPRQYHEYFYHGFIEGGTVFLDEIMKENLSEPVSNESPKKADLKPTTVAGIAGLGIFGAWIASRFSGGKN